MLLVLLQALLTASMRVERMRVERMRGPHATSASTTRRTALTNAATTTRRAALANAETTTRRAAFATAAATLATARRCDALQLEGEYADPNHVDGWRKIKVTGDLARITGQDDPGGPVWSINGLATDSTIALLVEPCVEINRCVGCRSFFTKSFLGDNAVLMTESSRVRPTPPRHRS